MIEGRLVVLGPVESQDSALLFDWINDPAIVHLHGPYRPVDEETHRQWLAGLSRESSTVVFAIRDAAERKLRGIVQLVGIHAVHRSAELRIRIGADADRGRGWGREAVDLACLFAFADLGLNRVFLNVYADNARAITAYEGAGFSYEGLSRRAAFVGGAWKDVMAMARFARDATSEGFTEADFVAHVRALKAGGYAFARFGETPEGPHVLWRHDVDQSPQRAARLAALEAAEGARATYFFNPRSDFYNLAEPAVAACVDRICATGHDLGLHFDAGAYPGGLESATAIADAVARERMLVEAILNRPVSAVSWHNPGLAANLLQFGDDVIAGLVNAYSDRLRRDYVYCSDSNGYWRFQPMLDVIAVGHPRLHLLTHPEWWTPAPLSPSARVDRALTGRARAVRNAYDNALRTSGRENKTQ